MNEQKLKENWKSSKPINNLMVDESKLKQSINAFENSIRFRNYREIIPAILIIFVLGYFSLRIEPLLSKIGIFILLLASVLIILKLFLAKNKKSTNLSDSVKDSLTNSLDYVKSEAKLLETVLWWYITPFSIGLILFFAGFGINLMFFILVGIVIIFAILIKYLNNKTLEKDYYSLIQNI